MSSEKKSISRTEPKKIIWFSWKDIKNPAAGGAERVANEIAKRYVHHGHQVVFLTAGFNGAPKEEIIDGYQVVRIGGRLTVYWRAFREYRKNWRGWADLVVDEINTMPFFAGFFSGRKTVLMVHQLCREIWFYHLPWPVALLGYILEPIYLRFLRRFPVITISESTRRDLARLGFNPEKIFVIHEGTELALVADLASVVKYDRPTMLAFGALRPMKRTHHVLLAFERAKKIIPELRLVIAGNFDGGYGRKVKALAAFSDYRNDIEFIGSVSREKKIELMQRCHVLCSASVKEGWGLVVTEANSQGTPAVVYDVDGLRDSVLHNKTGLVCVRNTPEEMALAISRALSDGELYSKLSRNCWMASRSLNFDSAYNDFKEAISRIS